MKIRLIFAGLALAVAALAAPAAHAAMDKAYVVMDEKNSEAMAPMLKYLKDSATAYEVVKPENLDTLKGKEYFIVIGAPKDGGPLAELAKQAMSEKQWNNASTMGKAGAVTAQSGDSQVLFLFSDFSLKSLVSGSKDTWTEIFYDWYDIPLSMTHIIGY